MAASTSERLLEWVVAPANRLPDPTGISSAEWDEIIAYSVAHTVSPQLFQRLRSQSETSALPPAVLQCAWMAAVHQRQLISRLEQELPILLRALSGAGIVPMLLKGAHLTTCVYSDPSHRAMTDLDLMVKPHELEAAEKALLGLGYRTERQVSIPDWCTRGRHIPPLLKDDCYPVELHWTLADPTDRIPLDLDGVWKRAVPATIYGERVLVPSPEDLLLHVCFHAGLLHHFGEKGFRPLLDVAAILERFGAAIDWNAVASRAREWRVERATCLMLELSRRHCAAKVPQEVLAALNSESISPNVFSAARAQLFERPGLRLSPVSPRSIALALANPLYLLRYLFRPRTMDQRPSAKSVASMLTSRYGGFAWRCLRGDRGLLGEVVRRTRRHLVLNAWLTKTERGGAQA